MSEITQTVAAFDEVEAFPTAPDRTTEALVPGAGVAEARKIARTATDDALLQALWRVHGTLIVRAVLENPATSDEMLLLVEAAAEQDLLVRRQLAAVRASRKVRHISADAIAGEDSIAAAHDTGRSANDLRILHHRFGRRTVVGMTLVGNPALPGDVLDRLLHHPAAMVRRAARHRDVTRRTGVDAQLMNSRQRAVNL